MARVTGEQKGERHFINFGVYPPRPGIVSDGKRAVARPDRVNEWPSNSGGSPMSEEIKHDRRSVLGAAATTIAAAQAVGVPNRATGRTTRHGLRGRRNGRWC